MTQPTLTHARRIAKRLGMDVYYEHEGHLWTINTQNPDLTVEIVAPTERLALVGFIAACEAIEAEVKRGKK